MVSTGLDKVFDTIGSVWKDIVPIVKGIVLQTLMSNKSIVDEMEVLLAPVFGAIWFSFQLMFIEGFCFSFASFDVMFKDANTADLIKKCNDTAYLVIVDSYKPTNYSALYANTVNFDATNAQIQ